eukprot:2637863-Pyramimonas_sp.AAC.1
MPMVASTKSPLDSGHGKGQSAARGSRSRIIITTRSTQRDGVSSGRPSLLRSPCRSGEPPLAACSKCARFPMPGRSRRRLHSPAVAPQAFGNWY